MEVLVEATEAADRVAVGPITFDPRRGKNNSTVRAVVHGRDAIESLLIALETTTGERLSRMMHGDPVLTFLDGNTVVAKVECLMPDLIRSDGLWSGDAPLRSSTALRAWLVLHDAAK